MNSILEEAKENLIELILDSEGELDIEGSILEVADSAIPVYDYDIMQAANDDYDLILVRPELASGEETPLDLIKLNIYEKVASRLYEFWGEAEDHVQEYIDKIDDLSDMELDEMQEILENDFDFEAGEDFEADDGVQMTEILQENYLEELKDNLESC